MRESIGALSIFSIVLTFIVLFTAYLAVSVNYANAFRVKNKLITEIENSEGIDQAVQNELENLLINQNYSVHYDCLNNNVRRAAEGWENPNHPIEIGKDANNNSLACIYSRTVENTGGEFCPITYYKVIVFFKMDLPILGDLLTFNIKGDTKGIPDRTNNQCVAAGIGD